MNREELVKEIAKSTKLSQKSVSEVLSATVESIYNWSVEMEKVGHKMENSSDFIKNFPF